MDVRRMGLRPGCRLVELVVVPGRLGLVVAGTRLDLDMAGTRLGLGLELASAELGLDLAGWGLEPGRTVRPLDLGLAGW